MCPLHGIGIRLNEMIRKRKSSRLLLRHSEHSLNDTMVMLNKGTNFSSGSVVCEVDPGQGW